MNEETKKDTYDAGDLKIIVISILLLAAIITFFVLYSYRNENHKDYNKQALDAFLKKYELVKQTETSEKIYDELIKIINNRKNCFVSHTSYNARTNSCRKEYVNALFRLARENIKSAPMPGLFIRCIRECPISGSLCSGEEGTSEKECIETEAKCIEFCLDEHWRGGTYPDEDDYTSNKKKEN